MCDKKNSVLFTDTECVVLSPDFKLLDENHVLLRVPRKDNMYSVDLKNIVPSGGLTCLFAKATLDESNLWHRRLGHINFKTMNKLVRGNLVRGLPSKIFENNHTCVACQKGKQHKASCKTKTVSSISQPLQMLHMDLFGPTFVKSLIKKMYCLVVTDDYSRFSWGFFLATKDETSEILKTFITGIENLIDLKVKVIRCDNGTKFKNKVMNQFCKMKGIKREFSVARTLQQNGVAERKNRTLIEVARTMLADSKLPTTFCAEAVNTACYVQNRVLVIKPHNKTPYELFLGRKPALSFMRPFRCHVTILNTIDHLGKFDGKADEGFFVGYSTNSKAFRVFNSRTRIVEENLHVKFSEETPNIAGNGPNWLFDIDALTISMNYKPVVTGNQTNGNADTKEKIDAGQTRMKIVPNQEYILLPLLTSDPSLSKSSKDSPNAGFKPSGEEEMMDAEHQENENSKVPNTEEPRVNQEQDESINRQNPSRAAVSVNTAKLINTAYLKPTVNYARPASNIFNRAHSHVRRPFNMFTSNKNNNFNEKVNNVKGNVTTVGLKSVVSVEANAVKASTCWVWRPKLKVLYHVSRHKVHTMNFKRFDYVDAQGRSSSVMLGGPQREARFSYFLYRIIKKLMVDLLPLEETPKEVESLVKDTLPIAKHLGSSWKKIVPDQEYILLPLLTSDPSLSKSLKDSPDAGFKPSGEEER
ncbi:putative ribonuclease H-like domain-containing protein [Tanacetum coccineum]|uniref:Ribonuclease H-like domain-containing protein n=1 Tax=Tanacetum coccineum TaxID=301880 RepID=A0ABQ5JFT1_9ASTR